MTRAPLAPLPTPHSRARGAPGDGGSGPWPAHLSAVESKASDARYRALLEAAPDAMVVVDPSGEIVLLNRQAERQFGYRRDELIGHTFEDLIPIGYPERLVADAQRTPSAARKQRIGGGVELIARRKDGTEFPIELMLSQTGPVDDVTVTAAIRDISDRKAAVTVLAAMEARYEAERAARRSEERFRRLFEADIIGITIAEIGGRTLEANDAYLGLLGFTREEMDAGGINWDERTPPDHLERDRAAIAELVATGVATPYEKELERRDGSRVPVLVGAALLEASERTCIAYVIDLSNRRLLEEQLRRAQKMEAIGQLAGGIAHDFNNLLTVILGHANLLVEELAEDDPIRESAEEIRDAGDRAATMTRQLLAFGRRQVLAATVLDPAEVVARIEKLLRRMIGEDVDLITTVDPGVGRIRADEGQVEQVLMNLAVNARDAMPDGGTLRISLAEATVDHSRHDHPAGLPPGRYVTIVVRDTGIGMSAETRAHIFEPFYTTKGVEKGTGLGLATAYGVVTQSGGGMTVASEPGEGATFTIYLPRIASTADVPATGPSGRGVAAAHDLAASRADASETLLLVEDDPAVRRVTRRMLEERGYQVLEASGGLEALARARRHDGRIHALLTDVVMRKMSGPELARRALSDRPEMVVIYMSGYAGDQARDLKLEPNAPFVDKPFTADTLVAAVRGALR